MLNFPTQHFSKRDYNLSTSFYNFGADSFVRTAELTSQQLVVIGCKVRFANCY